MFSHERLDDSWSLQTITYALRDIIKDKSNIDETNLVIWGGGVTESISILKNNTACNVHCIQPLAPSTASRMRND
jgi:hypothetical protein